MGAVVTVPREAKRAAIPPLDTSAPTPVNLLSNSRGVWAVVSIKRGSSSGVLRADVRPGSQVVAETTPSSASQGRKIKS